jgi:hypothetical protein
VVVNANNIITYTPAAGFVGADSFTYTISDGHGGTATATVSITISQNDLIFKDDLCSPTAWTTTANPSALTFPNSGGKSGCYMQVNITSNNPAYVRDNTPNMETRYRARFYFNPNGIIMGKSDSHVIFSGYSATGASMLVIELRRNGSSLQIRGGLLSDKKKWSYTGWSTLPSGWNAIELDWRAATGTTVNNGGLALWLNGTRIGNISNTGNYQQKVDWVALGAVSGLDIATRGTYFFDEFESRRSAYIGTLP